MSETSPDQVNPRRFFKGTETLANRESITTYVEFTGEVATRQVDIVGDRWFCSAYSDYHSELGPALTDQPLSAMLPLGEREIEISEDEFEVVWNDALIRCRPQ